MKAFQEKIHDPLPSRSEIMRRVGSKDTTPEIAVRKALWAAGLRYRLHRADLPGKPDIVLPSRRIAIFVHGCFWHRHEGCRRARMPATRQEYWVPKFERNVARDIANETALRDLGWDVRIVWECETKPGQLAEFVQDIISRTKLR
ncbi:very short patch repair endonuclease [Aurantimonas coralicida]|nr:very short patch repair endonuclease [Aurantimonas coralicida]